MAIELLFLTILVRKDTFSSLDLPRLQTLHRLFQWEPDWFREDEALMATTLMSPSDTRRFGKVLQARTGLHRGRDWAVLDMATGPTTPVPWLEWQGEGGSRAWERRAGPGDLAPVSCIIPGTQQPNMWKPRICKLFGRDSGHDDRNHREDFGRFLPDWGGRDLWLFEAPDPEADPSAPPSWASINLNHVDLDTL
jgi:hypothetical protein